MRVGTRERAPKVENDKKTIINFNEAKRRAEPEGGGLVDILLLLQIRCTYCRSRVSDLEHRGSRRGIAWECQPRMREIATRI